MQIDTGLFNHMVLQRDRSNVCDQPIIGKTSASGVVKARVRDARGNAVRGLNNATIGKASRGKFDARLRGVPTGGPYRIDLTIGDDTISIEDVLVGDVWIAAGQSNMQGCGRRPDRCKPHKSVRAFNMDDQWRVACDPIHNMWNCVDQVHIDLCGGIRPGKDKTNGVGPAVAFAQEMHKLSGGVPQGILACAHGGTSMAQWNPALKPGGGKSLYGATIRRLKKNGGRTAGMIWYQGESDSVGEPPPWKIYTKTMKTLIASLRRDAGDKRLPVAVVQLSRVVGGMPWPGWNAVQDQQRRLPDLVDRVTTVPAIDLALSDSIHISGKDQQRLGRRLADAMAKLVGLPTKSNRAPIALKSVSFEKNKLNGLADVIVKFDNVVGKLRTGGARPIGFTLQNASGVEFIYDIELDTDSVLCQTSAALTDLAETTLCYGRGIDPACNLTDEADRAIPVFGPMSVTKRRALTPFIKSMEVSKTQPSGKKLKGISYPAGGKVKFARRQWPAEFAEMHADLAKHGKDEVVLFYRCVVKLAEKMQLTAMVGYDGPIKVWVDKKLRLYDPTGTNPAMKDKKTIAMPGTAGKHEVMIALGSNAGLAWGVFLRFERTDVSKKQLESEDAKYAMPTVV